MSQRFQVMYFHGICHNLRLVMLTECSGSLYQQFYKIFQQMRQVRKSFLIQGRVMLKNQHCLLFSNCVNLSCKVEKFKLEVVGEGTLGTRICFQKKLKKPDNFLLKLYPGFELHEFFFFFLFEVFAFFKGYFIDLQ